MHQIADRYPNPPKAATLRNMKLCINCDGVFSSENHGDACPYCTSTQTLWLSKYVERIQSGQEES